MEHAVYRENADLHSQLGQVVQNPAAAVTISTHGKVDFEAVVLVATMKEAVEVATVVAVLVPTLDTVVAVVAVATLVV